MQLGCLQSSRYFGCRSLQGRIQWVTPLRDRLRVISHTLKTFYECAGKDKDVDGDILALLGPKTDEKHWLAASLDKTMRLQQGL